MRESYFHKGVVLACALFVAGVALAVSAGAQSDDELKALNQRVIEFYQSGKYAEAIPFAERSLELTRSQKGQDHPDANEALNNLALLYQTQGRYADAEPLYQRSLALREKALGPDHRDVGESLNNLANLYYFQGRYANAEPLLQRSLALIEKALGPDHPNVRTLLNNLAMLYQSQGRYADAEPLYKRSLALREKALGPDHPDVGTSLNNLAALYRKQGRYADAEPLYQRALTIAEKAGPDHPHVGRSLNNLADLYHNQGRYADAAPLYERTVAIFEKALGPDHPDVGTSLNNLAEVYRSQGRFVDATPLYQRALAIAEKALGPDHPDLGTRLNNLAMLYQSQGRYAEVEPLYRRTVAIFEKALGPDHPDVGESLNNLASLYRSQGRYVDAEPLNQRALAIAEKALGPDHPDVGTSLKSLAVLYFLQRDWARAADYGRRSTGLIVRRARRGTDDVGQALTGKLKSEAERSNYSFWELVKTVYRLGSEGRDADASLGREMFQTAQWASASEAARSLAQMAARTATGDPALSRLVRDRQDLVGEWQHRDQTRTAAVSQTPDKRDRTAETANVARLAAIDVQIAEIDKQLTVDFPNYAALVKPGAVSVEDIQAHLGADEALLLFLGTPEWKPTPEESFLWVVTKTDMRWVRVELGTNALIERVAALRCGLDGAAWNDALRCAVLLNIDLGNAPKFGEPLPFDFTRAHQLYRALFGQVEDLIKGKHLLIVPSGPLTQIPFHVLVTEQSDSAATGIEAFRRAAWLAKSNTITVLPSVSSLKALREHAKTSQATKAFVGFGNPLLDGPDARSGVRAEMARAKQQCPKSPWQRFPGQVAGGMKLMQQRGGLVNVAEIRTQVPLPETADELCAVARDLGVPDSDIWLGARANERDVKRLSDSGGLAAYRIVHFATHGALAGELKAAAEPGLILTPPGEASPEDDGYLSASEIAGLKLDADWVILSACNTAAGGTEGAEALSGMARAFFYAGARAVLVSHWAVDSDATVKLITKTLSTMVADKTIGRSEALRRSMVALIEQGEPHEAHPAYWAPFVVVGEGSVVGSAAKPLATSSIIPEPQPPTKATPSAARPRPSKRVTTPDWRSEVWRR